MVERRLPMLLMNSAPERLIGPKVSKATAWNLWVGGSPRYFWSLRSAACAEAGPLEPAGWVTYESAHVWTTVASHARYLHVPSDQGIKVAPSGRLPSDLKRPTGSLVQGTSALDKARQMMSLMVKWRSERPQACLQTKPW